MKSAEKQRARELRCSGLSYNDILRQVSVSKGTLTLWLRDIILTKYQIECIDNKQKAGRERFSLLMHARRERRWAEYQAEAETEYVVLSRDPAFMFGLALYVGEGSKTIQNEVCITNCDPRVIQKGVEFFLKIGVPYEALRCAIHLHPELCQENAESYWQQITGLPKQQFHKTQRSVSSASNGKKGNLQVYGTCQVRASSTKVRQKLSRWMDLALTARSFIG